MGQLHSRGGNEITRKQKVFTLKNFFLILSIADDPSGETVCSTNGIQITCYSFVTLYYVNQYRRIDRRLS